MTQQNQRPSAGAQATSKLLISTDFLLEGENVALRLGRPTDWQDWRDLRSQSRAFLSPWEPTWPADALTFGGFTLMLEKQWRDWKDDRGYAFLVFLKDSGEEAAPPDDEDTPPASPRIENPTTKANFSVFGRRATDYAMLQEMEAPKPQAPNKKPEKKLGPLVGAVAITDIVRSAALHGTLGYWIGAPYAQQGLMTESAQLVCDFAFNVLKLHRLKASCMPTNEPSLRLLANLGFEQEGLCRRSIRINGKWEDHALFALLSD